MKIVRSKPSRLAFRRQSRRTRKRSRLTLIRTSYTWKRKTPIACNLSPLLPMNNSPSLASLQKPCRVYESKQTQTTATWASLLNNAMAASNSDKTLTSSSSKPSWISARTLRSFSASSPRLVQPPRDHSSAAKTQCTALRRDPTPTRSCVSPMLPSLKVHNHECPI